MATPNLSEIVSTTLYNRSKAFADNVTDNNALLMRLEKRGKRKPFSGGRQIVQEIEYGENGTFGWYSGYDPLNISPSEVFTSAVFDIKQCSVAVSMSGLEELQNSGEEQVIDLLEGRISNAEKTMRNKMGEAVYSDGTADAGKQLGGLQLLVADAGTGTVGGINSSTFSFWQNYKYDATTDGGAAATAANIKTYMNTVWLNLVRGADKPDLIVADNNYYSLYWASLQDQQRFTSKEMGEAGFDSLKYKSADVVFDGGMGGNAPTNHMYFLNTDYIYMRPHSKREYVPLNPDRFSTNQDAMVKLMAWAGNMTTSGRKFQGILKD